MKKYDRLLDILTGVHALLAKHDEPQRKHVMQAIHAAERSDDESLKRVLNSLEFWGGSGSIIDLTLSEIPWTPRMRIDKVDQAALDKFIGELIHEMQDLKITDPRTQDRQRSLTQFH